MRVIRRIIPPTLLLSWVLGDGKGGGVAGEECFLISNGETRLLVGRRRVLRATWQSAWKAPIRSFFLAGGANALVEFSMITVKRVRKGRKMGLSTFFADFWIGRQRMLFKFNGFYFSFIHRL